MKIFFAFAALSLASSAAMAASSCSMEFGSLGRLQRVSCEGVANQDLNVCLDMDREYKPLAVRDCRDAATGTQSVQLLTDKDGFVIGSR